VMSVVAMRSFRQADRMVPGTMLDLTLILKALGIPTAIVAAFFAVRRFVHWLRPIQIFPSVRLVFDASGPDQVLASVTNVSSEEQVMVRCRVRSAYPVRTALLQHLKHPFLCPRLYPNIWYSAICFDLMRKEPIRLAPKKRQQLSYSLSNHLLYMFLTPKIQVEVQLSEGRLFRSRRIDVPEKWKRIPSLGGSRREGEKPCRSAQSPQ